MNKDLLIAIVGPSGSGKTTLAIDLEKNADVNLLESFTTRAPRYEGEKGHIFAPVHHGEQAALDILPSGRDVIAYAMFHGNHYWAEERQYKGRGLTAYVVNPSALYMLKQRVNPEELLIIYIQADESERRNRLTERDGAEKAASRIRHDRQEFAFSPADVIIDGNMGTNYVYELVIKAINMKLNNEI